MQTTLIELRRTPSQKTSNLTVTNLVFKCTNHSIKTHCELNLYRHTVYREYTVNYIGNSQCQTLDRRHFRTNQFTSL